MHSAITSAFKPCHHIHKLADHLVLFGDVCPELACFSAAYSDPQLDLLAWLLSLTPQLHSFLDPSSELDLLFLLLFVLCFLWGPFVDVFSILELSFLIWRFCFVNSEMVYTIYLEGCLVWWWCSCFWFLVLMANLRWVICNPSPVVTPFIVFLPPTWPADHLAILCSSVCFPVSFSLPFLVNTSALSVNPLLVNLSLWLLPWVLHWTLTN